MNKKDLPPVLLQSLNSLNTQLLALGDQYENLIIKVFNQKKLLKFKDIDPESNFKFELQDLSLSNGRAVFTIESAPKSSLNINSGVTSATEESVVILFKQWLAWLKLYDKTHLTPEDEFAKKYSDEFYSQFEIVDENADKEPFSFEHQLLLDDYLTETKEKLILFKKNKTQEEIEEIEKFIDEVETIRQVLTKESKKKIIRRLSTFFGKARKFSLELAREVVINFISDFASKLFIG